MFEHFIKHIISSRDFFLTLFYLVKCELIKVNISIFAAEAEETW